MLLFHLSWSLLKCTGNYLLTIMAIYGAKTPPTLAVVDPVPCAVFLKISLEFTVKRQLCRTATNIYTICWQLQRMRCLSEPKLGVLIPSWMILALLTETQGWMWNLRGVGDPKLSPFFAKPCCERNSPSKQITRAYKWHRNSKTKEFLNSALPQDTILWCRV